MWTPWKKLEERINYFIHDLESLKDHLEEIRVCKFIRVVTYKRGMDIHNRRPEPIRLEDLEKRIAALEAKHGDVP